MLGLFLHFSEIRNKRLVRSASNIDKTRNRTRDFVPVKSPLGKIPEKDYPMIPRAKSMTSLVTSGLSRHPSEPKRLWTKVAYPSRNSHIQLCEVDTGVAVWS